MEPARSAATGRDWLKFVLVQLTGLLVAAFVWLLWQLLEPISHTVVLFLLGAACAFVLAEPSSLLARRLGGNRMLGILLAYLIMFGIIIGAMLLSGGPVRFASVVFHGQPTDVRLRHRTAGRCAGDVAGGPGCPDQPAVDGFAGCGRAGSGPA